MHLIDEKSSLSLCVVFYASAWRRRQRRCVGNWLSGVDDVGVGSNRVDVVDNDGIFVRSVPH